MQWNLAELSLLRTLHEAWSCPFLDRALALVTTLGDHGQIFILLAFVLLCIPKTRKLGLGVALALILDLLLVNLGIKPLAARTRPFDLGVDYPLLVTRPGDYSFPSGHTAAATAAAVALLPAGKRVFYPMLAFASLMGLSRLYFMVHYPTDVLAGAVCGALCGILALRLLRRGETALARRRTDR